MKTSERLFAILSLALFCATLVYLSWTHPVHDFANYYFGGKFMREGRFTSQLYFPYTFNQMIVATGQPPLFAGFAPNTPFLAMLFMPLSWLPIGVAKIVFNLGSAILFSVSTYRLAAFHKVRSVYLLLIPVLFFVPLRNEILFGQVYLLLFSLLAESWLAYQKGRNLSAAILLSLAILLKVLPVLLLAFFLFKKEYRIVGYSIVSCLLLIGVTCFWCAPETWTFYFTDVLSKASNGEIASAYVDNYQSLYMFFKRMLVPDSVENLHGWLHLPELFSGLLLMVKAVIIALGFYITRKCAAAVAFSYWIFAMILMSPYGSTYTFVLLLFPMLFMAEENFQKTKMSALFGLLIIVCNLPLSAFMHLPFPASYLRLFALVALVVLLFSSVWKIADVKIVGGLCVVALLIGCLRTPENPQSALMLKESPLLVHHFRIENDRLKIWFWDGNGEHARSIAFPDQTSVSADLIRNAVYFRGKLIRTEPGHKLNPVIIDGRKLLYLSDHGRGIGFYTLRKIDL